MRRLARTLTLVLAALCIALTLVPTVAWADAAEGEEPVEAADTVPIYRMYNRKTSEHLYTKSYSEYNSCGKGYYSDWRAEGVAWEAPAPGTYGSVPVYRLYNRISGDHHYTTSKGEKSRLIASGDWRDEGVAFYSGGFVAVYRVYNGRLLRGQHHYTTSASERSSLVSSSGWRDEGIGFYCVRKGKPVAPSGRYLLDNDLITITVTGSYIGEYNGWPTYKLTITNHTNRPIYVTDGYGTWYWGNKMISVWLGATIQPGKYIETELEIMEEGASSMSAVHNVEGVIEVWDNNTLETLGEYKVKLA